MMAFDVSLPTGEVLGIGMELGWEFLLELGLLLGLRLGLGFQEAEHNKTKAEP